MHITARSIRPIRRAFFGILALLIAVPLAGCYRDMTVPDEQPPAPGDMNASAASTTIDGWTTYGEPGAIEISAAAEPVRISSVVADPSAYEGRPLLLEGEITEVCQTKGCWLKMADDAGQLEEAVFVKFTCPVDGFLIPKDSAGRAVVVAGEVVVEEMSEEDARHIAEESGRSADEVAEISGPQKVIRVMSPTARVKV